MRLMNENFKKKLFMCQLEINSIGENKNGESL